MIRIAAALVAAATGRERSGVESALRGLLYRPVFSAPNLRVGPGVRFVGRKNIRLGADVTFFGNAYVNATGERGYVEIGDRTHVDQFCVLYGQGGLAIGSKCAVASGVMIYSQSNQYASDPPADVIDQPVVYAPVRIGDDVWIGAGAVVLPGVTVGDHAVIAAGAVVRNDVAPWTVVGGVPARLIGDRRSVKAEPA
jgi:acetyltransferase-like isoleucine patch superfamily enzyme